MTNNNEPITFEEIQSELLGIHHCLVDLQRQINGHEEILKSQGSMSDLVASVNRVNALLVGENGKNGLKDTVERLLILIEGDERVGAVGLRYRLRKVEYGLDKLAEQRNMLRWILYGMGLAALTNTGALITVISKLGQGVP